MANNRNENPNDDEWRNTEAKASRTRSVIANDANHAATVQKNQLNYPGFAQQWATHAPASNTTTAPLGATQNIGAGPEMAMPSIGGNRMVGYTTNPPPTNAEKTANLHDSVYSPHIQGQLDEVAGVTRNPSAGVGAQLTPYGTAGSTFSSAPQTAAAPIYDTDGKTQIGVGHPAAPAALAFDMHASRASLYKSNPEVFIAGTPQNKAFVDYATKYGEEAAHQNAGGILSGSPSLAASPPALPEPFGKATPPAAAPSPVVAGAMSGYTAGTNARPSIVSMWPPRGNAAPSQKLPDLTPYSLY